MTGFLEDEDDRGGSEGHSRCKDLMTSGRIARWSTTRNLVSHAGLVPVLQVAEQAGLSQLLDEHVRFVDERVKSGTADPTPNLISIIAAMAAGADSIDDLDLLRAGGMKQLFGGVYAAATLGSCCGSSPTAISGNCRQFAPAPDRPRRTDPRSCPASTNKPSSTSTPLLRPVYGHTKQDASFGHEDRREDQPTTRSVPARRHHLTETAAARTTETAMPPR